jgi:hypothetical protein
MCLPSKHKGLRSNPNIAKKGDRGLRVCLKCKFRGLRVCLKCKFFLSTWP